MVRDQQQINFESIVPMRTQFRKTHVQWTEENSSTKQNKRKIEESTNNRRIKYVYETENTQLDWAAQNENGSNLCAAQDVLN